MMRVFLLFVLLPLFAACTGDNGAPLVAHDIEISTPAPGARMSAGYLRLENNTGEEIRISRVTSPQYESVEIHESSIEDGIARMRRLDELVVPAGGSVVLERGGKHLMLKGPKGEFDSVALAFYVGDGLVLTTTSGSL